ncbi:MAG: PqqD family protein [Gammaproteobacteria bacterium]|nr:PqqD family protein [Gammaproteobacteria bacterium]
MNDTPTYYTRATGLEVHETKDGLIVFNPATDRVHHLNYTAGVIFELCEEALSTAALIDLMAQLFSLEDPPRAAIETGLRQLVDEGVLVEAPIA